MFPEVERHWRIPLVGEAPGEVPDEWIAALAAIVRDLRCRRYGRVVSFDGLEWELAVTSEGWVHIGMARLPGDADLNPFSIGRGYTLETTTAQAIVWVAEVVQGELAGYEFVQWPSDGRRLLTPSLRGGDAVWIDPSTSSIVSAIGALCDGPECS